MASQRFLDCGQLGSRHIAGLILALMPTLQLVKGRTARPPGLRTKFAAFHAGDGVDFAENFLAALFRIHDLYLYY